jgi:hypothetical protein
MNQIASILSNCSVLTLQSKILKYYSEIFIPYILPAMLSDFVSFPILLPLLSSVSFVLYSNFFTFTYRRPAASFLSPTLK